jgi:hypothetical protein
MKILGKSVSSIWVRGAENTSDLECTVCKGWLNHWKKKAGLQQNDEISCCHLHHKTLGEKVADRGAHVMKCHTPEGYTRVELSQEDISDIKNKKMYIIPVCDKHNITGTEVVLIPKEYLMDAEPCDDDEWKLVRKRGHRTI